MKQIFRTFALILVIMMSTQVMAQSKYPEWTRTAEGLPLEVLKAGEGARGTVILAHGCNGPSQQVDAAWAVLLRDEGFNTVGFDSWQFRKISGGVCSTGAVSGDQRVKEVELTIAWLKNQPWHTGPIFMIGWSNGGHTALAASVKKDLGISKIVAIYPRCNRWYSEPVVPTQIHIGEEDDWTPAHLCKGLYTGLFSDSPNGQVFIYPNAYHDYDRSVNSDGLFSGMGDNGQIRKFRLKTDETARELTIKRVVAFFKE